MRSHSVRLLIIVGLVLAVCACATVGEKNFACPGRPPGVHCMSATEVYEATHATDVVAVTAPKALGSDPKRQPSADRVASGRSEKRSSERRTRESGAAKETVEASEPSREVPLTPAIEKPIPIRTQAQVMRAWIAPRGIASDVLDSGGYLFIEIESRRWALGDMPMTNEPVRFFSIQSAVDTKESVGKDRSPAKASSGASERAKRTSTLPKEPSHESTLSEHHR